MWERTKRWWVVPQDRGDQEASGTKSGTISASNIEPPQVGISLRPR